MAGLDLYAAQQAIKDYFVDVIPWQVVSGSFPEPQSIRYNNGVLDPYVVLQFTDMLPRARGASFGGSRHDSYYSYVNAFCVAETDEQARELANLVRRYGIGKSFPNVSELRPIFGGGIFAITSGNRQPIAFSALVALQFETNIDGVAEESLIQ